MFCLNECLSPLFDSRSLKINGMFSMIEQHGKQLLKMSSFQFWSHENKLKMTIENCHESIVNVYTRSIFAVYIKCFLDSKRNCLAVSGAHVIWKIPTILVFLFRIVAFHINSQRNRTKRFGKNQLNEFYIQNMTFLGYYFKNINISICEKVEFLFIISCGISNRLEHHVLTLKQCPHSVQI